jgi:hypothetical protein
MASLQEQAVQQSYPLRISSRCMAPQVSASSSTNKMRAGREDMKALF